MRNMCIAPGYVESDFPNGMSDDDRINVFFRRINDWILSIADQCINGGENAIPHSGFAVLSIVFSYFEFIAKCQAGYQDTGASRCYFERGVCSVFPELAGTQEGRSLLSLLWTGARNGLYHACLPDAAVAISGSYPLPLQSDTIHGRPVAGINPHRLVPVLIQHFEVYRAQCCDHRDAVLRTNLLKRLSCEIRECGNAHNRVKKEHK
jgi:hypothetical protein